MSNVVDGREEKHAPRSVCSCATTTRTRLATTFGNLLFMSVTYRFTTLDDAYAFLLEASGLPVIPTATPRVQRNVRSCILLSWVALEEGLECAIELWKNERRFGPLPRQLKPRLSAVLEELSRPPFDDEEFRALRQIRNKLTHPRATKNEPELTVEVAEKTFEFCIAAIRSFFPFRVVCEIS